MDVPNRPLLLPPLVSSSSMVIAHQHPSVDASGRVWDATRLPSLLWATTGILSNSPIRLYSSSCCFLSYSATLLICLSLPVSCPFHCSSKPHQHVQFFFLVFASFVFFLSFFHSFFDRGPAFPAKANKRSFVIIIFILPTRQSLLSLCCCRLLLLPADHCYLLFTLLVNASSVQSQSLQLH